MTFAQVLNTPYLDILFVAVCVALAYFSRHRLQRVAARPKTLRQQFAFALIGLVLFLGSFIWCAIALAMGLSDAGAVLVPALVLVGLGWVILIANSIWMQEHALFLTVAGSIGILGSGLWLLLSAGALSTSSPQNFYVIFYPPILGVTASALALATYALRWFFRMTGVISD